MVCKCTWNQSQPETPSFNFTEYSIHNNHPNPFPQLIVRPPLSQACKSFLAGKITKILQMGNQMQRSILCSLGKSSRNFPHSKLSISRFFFWSPPHKLELFVWIGSIKEDQNYKATENLHWHILTHALWSITNLNHAYNKFKTIWRSDKAHPYGVQVIH